MEELRKLLQDNLNIEFQSATLSNPRQKEGPVKIKVRPVLRRGKRTLQFELFQNNQVFHKNVALEEAGRFILEYGKYEAAADGDGALPVYGVDQ